MVVATKIELLARRGPEPLAEYLKVPGTDLTISIHGIVRSFKRAEVYREIENMSRLRDVLVDGERVPVTEDDIVAACWAEACVDAPQLTALEWLTVGAADPDLLAQVGARCLVCCRLMADDNHPDGFNAADEQNMEGRDPLATTPSSSVSTNLEGCPEKSKESVDEPAKGSTRSAIA